MDWTTKYRPTSIHELALPPEHRRRAEAWLRSSAFPPLMLTGPPGRGKSSFAEILIDGIGATNPVQLDQRTGLGVRKVRGLVTDALKARWVAPTVIYIEEAEGLTKAAQKCLQTLMDDYQARNFFILVANSSSFRKPVKSRCRHLRFDEIPLCERSRVLNGILEAEGFDVGAEAVSEFAAGFRDLRQMVLTAQDLLTTQGRLPESSRHE